MKSINAPSLCADPLGREKRGALFAIFGNPIAQSLSPLMHNAAFAKLGIKATYTAYEVKDATQIIQTIRQCGIWGASVTIPFKETVMPLLDDADSDAVAIGAVNTIVNRRGRLTGHNTDSPGMIRDLEEWIDISGKTFIVLGAGGAARAAVFALIRAGGTSVVVNRNPKRAEALAGRFDCRWAQAAEIGRLKADCLINTIPVGMFPETDRTPLPKRELARFPRVMDMIYNPVRTRLLREAEAVGCAVRSGVGMFIHQGAEQFRLWTGMEPPLECMRQAVLERLKKNDGN